MQPVHRSAFTLAVLAIPAVLGTGCSDSTAPRFDSRTPYTVFIATPADSVPAWSDVKMVVTAVDSTHHEIDHPRLSWHSSDTLVATVDSLGVLHTRGGGYTTVRVWSSRDTAAVLVTVQTPRVATLKLPDTVRAPLLTVLNVPYQALDAQGRPVNAYLLVTDSGKLVHQYVGPPVTVHTGTSRLYARTSAGGSTSITLVVGAPLSMSAFPDAVAMLVGDTARQLHTRAPWPWWGQGCGCGGPSDATSGVESWSSSDPGIASVDSTGHVSAVAAGHATITAAAPSTGASAKIEVYVYRYSPALSYVEVGSMTTGVCARTADGRAACSTATFGSPRLYSGDGTFGTLSPSDRCETWVDSFHGPPSIYSFRCAVDPLLVDGQHQFTSLAAQTAYEVFSACGIDDAGATWCWGAQPVKQDSLPPLKTITAFASRPTITYCGLDLNGAALCFGVGGAPTPVTGGHTFTSLATMERVGCAIDDASVTWCWGNNQFGTLGDSTTTSSNDPVRVHTTASFTAIALGGTDPSACALDSAGFAWCWGGVNQAGAVPGVTSLVPKRAPTNESFTSIAVSNRMACGVTSTGSITCWDPVAGTGAFAGPAGSDWTSVFSGEDHICAVTSAGRAGCWTQISGAVSLYAEIPRGG